MKKTLIIGSSVCDVRIRVHHMPQISEDENIIEQSFCMGGCAWNVASLLRCFHRPMTLFSPVGKGFYGDFVRHSFEKEGIPILIDTNEKNGCCYCVVDDSGERTFLCEHGAEYRFDKEWFKKLNIDEYQQVYICGLEIEEETGEVIVEFLENNPHLEIYFALGPRVQYVREDLLERIFALHPILHLNKQEILSFTKQVDLEIASKMMHQKTNQVVVVTLGDKGCYYYDGYPHYIKGVQTTVVDTIGAGDSHIGTILAYSELSWENCLYKANEIASLVVSKAGANL